MKILALVAFALVAALPAAAQVEVRGIDIVEHGIYTADLQSATRDKLGVQQNISTNFRRAVDTTQIPAQLGLRFGVRYKVVGAPADGTVTIREVVVYPPAGLRSPSASQVLHRSESTSRIKIGDITYTGYKFDDPWEQVPGPWTIELWYGNRKLAERKFTVVTP